jgi:heme A synthase
MTVSTVQQAAEIKRTAASDRLFRTLVVTGLVSTILLIMVGSIVRVTGFGLGCPDWPLCYGQAIPPFLASAWVEFAHRLFGGAVVIQIGALIYLAWKHYRQERWIFRPAIAIAVVTAVQVLLGGIHVIYELPRWTGWVHTGVAMLVAGLLALWLALSQPALERMGERAALKLKESHFHQWLLIIAAASYLLILTGSLVTRTGASLVCPSFPDCGLETIPDNLRTIVAIQMVHRLFAITVGTALVITVWQLWRVSDHEEAVRNLAVVMTLLVSLQFALGLINIWYAIPMWSRVLHLGTATMIWVLTVILGVAVWHGREYLTISAPAPN